jgi:hypothetical protein
MFSRLSHSTLFKVALILAAIGVVLSAGVLLFDYIESSAPNSSADIVYAVKTPSGGSWYEIHNGRITTFPALSGASITGVARDAAGKTFVLGVTGSASTLYSYSTTTKAYTTVFTTPEKLTDLSVSSDGLSAVFACVDEDSSVPAIDVLDLTTKSMTAIGAGYSPIILGGIDSVGTVAGGKPFISKDGYLSVLYFAGYSIEANTFHMNTWSKPVNAYLSAQPFAATSAFAGNNLDMFAFVEPALSIPELWKLNTPAPFTVSPKTLYGKGSASVLGFSKGALVSLTLEPATSKAPTSVEVATFAAQSQDASATASSTSITIPLKAAGSGMPSFIGIISS